jgi:MFS family permease
LFFGWLADRMGRRKLFLMTLAVYLVATEGPSASSDRASEARARRR